MNFAKMLMEELSKSESEVVKGFIRLLKGHAPKKGVFPDMDILNSGDLLKSEFFSNHALHDVRLVGGSKPFLSHKVTKLHNAKAAEYGLSSIERIQNSDGTATVNLLFDKNITRCPLPVKPTVLPQGGYHYYGLTIPQSQAIFKALNGFH